MFGTMQADWKCAAALMGAVALGAGLALSARADQAPVTPPGSNQEAHTPARPLDNRVAVFTRALGLDAAQQAQLTRVLEERREQISRVWSDTAVPAANRIAATRAIENHTADQIRALLNDEQKKKYNLPRPAQPVAPDPGQRSVEEWMEATRKPAPAGH
jgi:hypothetical protein